MIRAPLFHRASPHSNSCAIIPIHDSSLPGQFRLKSSKWKVKSKQFKAERYVSGELMQIIYLLVAWREASGTMINDVYNFPDGNENI